MKQHIEVLRYEEYKREYYMYIAITINPLNEYYLFKLQLMLEHSEFKKNGFWPVIKNNTIYFEIKIDKQKDLISELKKFKNELDHIFKEIKNMMELNREKRSCITKYLDKGDEKFLTQFSELQENKQQEEK
jgi:hypothetical protein